MLLKLFRKSDNSKEAYRRLIKDKKIGPSQVRVLKAIKEIGPAHYRQISEWMGVIEGSVTPRIRELRRKRYVEIAYIRKGFSKNPVNYYRITGRGVKFLQNLEGDL